jgi:hypothetical protein
MRLWPKANGIVSVVRTSPKKWSISIRSLKSSGFEPSPKTSGAQPSDLFRKGKER